MLQFDLTVTLGDLIQIGTLIGAVLIGYHKVIIRLTVIETHLGIDND